MRPPRLPKRPPEHPGPDQGELVVFDVVPDEASLRSDSMNVDDAATTGWDGNNHKDGFHFGPLSDEQKRRNAAGAKAARAAMHATEPAKSDDLPGIVDEDPKKPNPREDITRKRMAVSRLLATFVMPHEQTNIAISAAAIQAANPSNLAKHLFGVRVIVNDRNKGVGKQAAMYQKPNGDWQAVALSARERKLLKYNIQAYADAPYITTKASKTYNPAHDPAAPVRAVYHLLDDSIVPKMETYVATLLERERILRQFDEALAPGHYGLARMGNEATMRGNASILFDQILPDALDAIGEQKQWTPEKAILAYATIIHRVTALDAHGKRDFKYTRAMVNVLRTHNIQKIRLFESSIKAGKSYSELHHHIADEQTEA